MRDVQRTSQMPRLIYSLHRGRSQRALIRVIPDGRLYRVEWPDVGISDLTNLTRAKDAAFQWAESKALVEDRKTNAARRLKSLNNFYWSSSPVAQNAAEAA